MMKNLARIYTKTIIEKMLVVNYKTTEFLMYRNKNKIFSVALLEVIIKFSTKTMMIQMS